MAWGLLIAKSVGKGLLKGVAKAGLKSLMAPAVILVEVV